MGGVEWGRWRGGCGGWRGRVWWVEGAGGVGGGGGWVEEAGGVDGGGWEAGGGLHLPIGLFGVAMIPRSAGYRPRQGRRALRDVSPTQG